MGAIKHFSYISNEKRIYSLNETIQPISISEYFQSLESKGKDSKTYYTCTVMGYALAILEITDELRLTSSSHSGIKQYFSPYIGSEWSSVRKRKSEYLKVLSPHESKNTKSVDRIHTKTLIKVRSLLKRLCPYKNICSLKHIDNLFLDRGEDHLVP